MRPDPIDVSLEELLRNASWLRRLALSLVRDSDEAEDLVQETWVRALEKSPQETARNRPWLARVLRNSFLQKRRSDLRRAVREKRTPRLENAPGPDELVDRAETGRLLTQTVIGLEEPYRSTLLLRFHEDLTTKQIARQLGVPAATVRVRLHRGLIKLREEVGRSWGRSWSECSHALAVYAGTWGASAGPSATGLIAASFVVLAPLVLYLLWPPSETSDSNRVVTAAPTSAESETGMVELPSTKVTGSSPSTEGQRKPIHAGILGGRPWNAVILASGKAVKEAGTIRFQEMSENGFQSVKVTDGNCFIPESMWDASFLGPKANAWFLPTDGFPSHVVRASSRMGDPRAPVLEIHLGGWKEILVTVTDLRGDPIPGAQLQVYGATTPGGSRRTCDSLGRWQGKLFGEASAKLIIRAAGYGSSSAKILFDGAEFEAQEIKLGRFLAYGHIQDRRERYNWSGRQSAEVTGFSIRPNSPDYRNLLDRIEAESDIDPEFEVVYWTVVVERDEWLEGGYTLTRIHNLELVSPESIEVPFRHVLDPSLAPIRFPGTWPKERVQAIIRFDSTPHFSAKSSPKELQLLWTKQGPEPVSGGAVGQKLASESLEYSFFVPEGEYSIENYTRPVGVEIGRSPRIEAIEGFQVLGDVYPLPTIKIKLADDCFYSGYTLEDSSGIPLELAGLISEAHSSTSDVAGFMAGTFDWPKYRFFSDVEYQLWLAPHGLWAIPVGPPVLVDPPSDGEIIRIRVPSNELEGVLTRN